MITYDLLTKEIHDAFPSSEAPEKFRADYQNLQDQGLDPESHGLGDYVTVAFTYRALPWWELLEKCINDGTLAFMVNEYVTFLDKDAWRYYVPMFLLYCIDAQRRDPIMNAPGNAEFLQRQFGDSYREAEFDKFTPQQKRCIAKVIQVVVANISPRDNDITPETLAYWSQYI